MAAHGMRLGDDSGVISPRHQAYIIARAKGGASLVSASSLPVHPTSQTFAGLQIRTAGDDLVPSLSATADAVHAAGSKLAVTLWHGGYNVTWLAGRAAVGPSAVANSMGQVPKTLSVDEIHEIIAAYGAAAARCRTAGIDVLEVQTSTDYLLGAFLSPVLNRRTDDFGGSFDNRLRIVRAVLDAVRTAVGPGVAVGIRTSIAHHMPGAQDDYDASTSLQTVAALEAGRVARLCLLDVGLIPGRIPHDPHDGTTAYASSGSCAGVCRCPGYSGDRRQPYSHRPRS